MSTGESLSASVSTGESQCVSLVRVNVSTGEMCHQSMCQLVRVNVSVW